MGDGNLWFWRFEDYSSASSPYSPRLASSTLSALEFYIEIRLNRSDKCEKRD
jgi:hypothetical protein